MVAARIERRWLDTLVALRQYADLRSDGWRRTTAAIDRTREQLGIVDGEEALAAEYMATVLLRRVRVDDPATYQAPFVRDAGFALRYVEIRTGARLSATALPSWLGEWAVVDDPSQSKP